MAKLYNRVRQNVSGTPGTGTVTLGSAYSNAFFTFAEAGVSNGDQVVYVIEDGTDFELGLGTYTSSGTTLSRDTVRKSKISGTAGTTKLTLTSAAQVRITALKEDIANLGEAQTFVGNQSITGTLTVSGLITATAGQISFPASQNASADANTLDDYEEGTWTPVLTFATPGNLSVAYAAQQGSYTKIGRHVEASFLIQTSTFTFTTASGNLNVTGLPFTAGNFQWAGPCVFSGVTKAGYGSVSSRLTNSATLDFLASGSGVAYSNVVAADTPTAGTVLLVSSIGYHV